MTPATFLRKDHQTVARIRLPFDDREGKRIETPGF
jgi:hypothetical protein